MRERKRAFRSDWAGTCMYCTVQTDNFRPGPTFLLSLACLALPCLTPTVPVLRKVCTYSTSRKGVVAWKQQQE